MLGYNGDDVATVECILCREAPRELHLSTHTSYTIMPYDSEPLMPPAHAMSPLLVLVFHTDKSLLNTIQLIILFLLIIT